MNAINPRGGLPERFGSIASKIIDGYTYGRAHFSNQELHLLIPYAVMLNEQRHTLAYEDLVNLYGSPDDNDHIGYYIGKLYDDVLDHSETASAVLAELVQNAITRSQIVKHAYPHVILHRINGGERG
jgi:hypothetical protein